MGNQVTRGLLLVICMLLSTVQAFSETSRPINLAVEFVDHAACAHIAKHHNWYAETGLNINAFDSYATGMGLSAALAKGSIDAAYICLLPAINAYANAHVPIKVVAGTHLYGYGLIVNPEKIKTVKDLSGRDIRLGCTREGSPPAALLHKLQATYDLDPNIVTKSRRMSPPKLLLALKTGQLDAAFMPEQFPTMGESDGFKELISARDLWSNMQGSVLVVRRDLIRHHPDVVEKLVGLTRRGIQYIHDNPEQASIIVARELNVMRGDIFPVKLAGSLQQLTVSPDVIQRSLDHKLVNTVSINPAMVQEMINYAAKIGSIKKPFPAEEILDLRFLYD
ncbi:ABC transporter substrate-binding protein [Desulfobacula sp.]|uniref:ABC transporter substrate-binding protein n=1 Tax=Desulfobacula sp. TaxID=2593537 RepID=UPI002632C152|nr:ABC transporter substrate-binding protein [Desulfobacula sp.]